MRSLHGAAILLLLVPNTLAAAAEEPVDRRLLWMAHAPDFAEFVPAPLMEGRSSDDLPILEAARKRLETELGRARMLRRNQKLVLVARVRTIATTSPSRNGSIASSKRSGP